MSFKIFQVDAFTERPFSGNPAAVCLLREDAPASWMQSVAAEMNLSETAFLLPREGGYGLRWFTPAVEVPLCGHATLASAHTIWELGLVAGDATIRFWTASGELGAQRSEGLIWLDLPARSTESRPLPELVRSALGVPTVWEGIAGSDLVAELESEDAIRALTPDAAALRAALEHGIIVTAKAGTPGLDFVSRYFAPGAGIDEDPVTGSAHCTLGPLWMGRTGKALLQAYQASKRGGELSVRVEGDRVFVGGHAVTVLRGELVAP